MRFSPGHKNMRRRSGNAILLCLFALVFLMLFAGVFSRSGKAGTQRAAAAGKGYAASPLALMDPWFPAVRAAGTSDSLEQPAFSVADLIPGDVLVGRCADSPVPCLDPSDAWTHACLYIGNNRIVVAGNPFSGVIKDSISSWMYPDMTWVTYLRVTTADEQTRKKAVEFALSKVGQPYDINWMASQLDGDSWYCSELVWSAYYHASDGSIDLRREPDIFGVSPDEIYTSKEVRPLGGHYERKPETISSAMMKIVALCILMGGLVLPAGLSMSRGCAGVDLNT